MKVTPLLFVIILLLTGCSSAGSLKSWKSGDQQSKKYARVMILGLAGDEAANMRGLVENRVAIPLTNSGRNAISSSGLLGENLFTHMDEDDALYQLNNNCIDAVLTVALLNRDKESKYFPGVAYYSPFSYYYERFWRYRTAVSTRQKSPLYLSGQGRYFWECNLYDMVTQRIIYTVHSRSFGGSDFEKAAVILSRRIAKDFVTNGW